MNRKNIEQLFRNYMDHFDYFDNDREGHESYKWDAMGQVQDAWDLNAKDLSGMIKKAFSKTVNLINNRIVSPGNGLVLLAKEEPEAVRKALEGLLAETDDADEKQDQILTFVDDINTLLEKHFPGKWKYTHDLRVAVTYLALIIPSRNYLFKSTPAHYFARYMGYDTDLGYGAAFKLKYYYQMCDELLAEVEACPELLAKNETRNCGWKDKSNHLLVTDLIFCFEAYDFMKDGMDEPPKIKKAGSPDSAAERARKAKELQAGLEMLQDEIDAIEKQISDLPAVRLEGTKVKTKAFGEVVIDRQDGNYITFTAQGKEKQFALPDCVVKGFVIPEDPAVIEQCSRIAEKLGEIEKLSREQRLKTIELRKYL